MRTKLAIALLVLLSLGTAGSTMAGPSGCTNSGTLFPFAFEQVTVSSTAVGFTAATFGPSGQLPAALAVVTVESNAVRYRSDGLNPTATVGMPVLANGSLLVCGEAALRRIRFIRQAADAIVSVEYYREGNN